MFKCPNVTTSSNNNDNNIGNDTTAAQTNHSAEHATIETEWMRQLQWTFMHIIFPTELILGFACQMLNFVVLHRYRIRTLSYTVYLRTLCVIYLLAIPLIATSFIRKNGFFEPLRHHYAVVFFVAHLELYLVNVLLFSANLITTALAAESLRGLMYPFKSITGDSKLRSARILFACLFLTATILGPLPFTASVEGPDPRNGHYCIKRLSEEDLFARIVLSFRNVLACTFEVVLVLILMGLYGALYVKYREIMRTSQQITASNRLNCERSAAQISKTHKAIGAVLRDRGICLGSIGAYVISNLPSAFKETLYMVNWLADVPELSQFFKTNAFTVFKNICNMALFFNFSLIVCLQLFTSLQYRDCVFRLFGCSHLLDVQYFAGPTTNGMSSYATRSSSYHRRPPMAASRSHIIRSQGTIGSQAPLINSSRSMERQVNSRIGEGEQGATPMSTCDSAPAVQTCDFVLNPSDIALIDSSPVETFDHPSQQQRHTETSC